MELSHNSRREETVVVSKLIKTEGVRSSDEQVRDIMHVFSEIDHKVEVEYERFRNRKKPAERVLTWRDITEEEPRRSQI